MQVEMELTAREIQAVLRQSFSAFIERSFMELNPETRYVPADHIDVLATKLEQCRRGEIKRVIVNLPPRSLKSHSATVAFPAWLLGHNPATQIICASYGQDLADKHARDCRTIMANPFYRKLFPGTVLSPSKSSVDEYATTRHGFRMATSVGGVLTGRGADFIILDDPQKPDEAMSDTKRKSVKEWFDNSLLSRLNDKQNGVIIIVMQRLHQDDLVGHVLEQDGGWEVVKFPAIAEEDETFIIDDIWGRRTFERRTGDALYAEREPIQLLKRIRADLGEYNFSSQYQQNPIPPGGAMVKLNWLRSYDPNVPLPEFTHILQSWDTANKAGELNDYSVCTTWGFRDRKDCYLLDVYRKRVDFPNLKRAVIEYARKYEPHTILVEDKASGTQLIQDLKFEGIFNIVPYEPAAGTDKVVRLHTQTPVFESGHVFLPSEASWRSDYITELAAFPGSKYDDQVDSTTQALQYLTSVLRQLSIYDLL